MTSPLSQNSPFETHKSVVVNRNTGLDINPTRLDFKTTVGQVESKFSNMHMIQSQVMPGYSGSNLSQSKSGFGMDYNMNSSMGSRFGANDLGKSKAVDPMKESTMSYMRSIYRGTPNIS